MDNEVDFNKATRRLLYRRDELQSSVNVPGAGKSAAARPERHIRVKVTMNLDGDVIAFFKDRAQEDGQPYQTLINQILKEYVNGSRPERMAKNVAEILANDGAFLSLLAEKIRSHEK